MVPFPGTCFFFLCVCVCNLSTYMHQNNFKQTHVQTQTLKENTNHEGPPKNPYPKAKPPGNIGNELILKSLLSILLMNFHLRNSVTSMTFRVPRSMFQFKKKQGRKNNICAELPFLDQRRKYDHPISLCHMGIVAAKMAPLELAVGTKKSSKGSCILEDEHIGRQCTKLYPRDDDPKWLLCR